MPELLEVEAYRHLAERALGRAVAEVVAEDAWYLKRGLTAAVLTEALTGRRLASARRTGKLLLLDTDDGATLGLRFGMAGRLLVDGHSAHGRPDYASATRDVTTWDRFALRFADGGDLRIRDPRRLGGVELDPDESRLGPDALTVTERDLGRRLADSRLALKARLMDQARVAGLGNLMVDELLWRAGFDPARPAGSLGPAEVRHLHRHLRRTAREMMARGGSHTGDLHDQRRPGGSCPRDGTPLQRRTVGGRTTWSCPLHQR